MPAAELTPAGGDSQINWNGSANGPLEFRVTGGDVFGTWEISGYAGIVGVIDSPVSMNPCLKKMKDLSL